MKMKDEIFPLGESHDLMREMKEGNESLNDTSEKCSALSQGRKQGTKAMTNLMVTQHWKYCGIRLRYSLVPNFW